MSETDTRLFGLPDAEIMYLDEGSVYDVWMDDRFEDDYYPDEGFVINEFTALPLSAFMPSVETVLEWIGDSTFENDVSEHAGDAIYDATKDPAVVGAFGMAMRLLGSKMTGFWMSDKLIAEHRVTWDENRVPLLDGEPLYRSRKASDDAAVD